MQPKTDPARPADDPLWQIVQARDRALLETRKTYDRRCAELEAAVRSTKEYLAKVETARDEAKAATEKTIQYLQLVERDRDQARADQAQTVDYLKQVEQDSAERLASIQFHQEKLKQAYADHAHNVAYIERLHAEIAAHVKVAEEHGQIIADLNEKLRAALERR